MITIQLTQDQIGDLVLVLGGAVPLYSDLGETEFMPRHFKKWALDCAHSCETLSAEITRQHNEQVRKEF